MMSGVIIRELQAVGAAFAGGAAVTFAYDLLRIFRRGIRHGNVWIAIEDAFFWIWAAFWIFSVLYRENDGSFRGYMLAAMAGGMIIYHQTVSTPFVEFMGKILKKLVCLVIFPLKKIKNKLKNEIQSFIIKFKHFKNRNGKS